MKNLEGKELNNKIANQIYKALEKSENPEIKIRFIFKIQDDPDWKCTYKISCFAGIIKFKDINFKTVSNDTAIKIIIDNFYVDCFSFLDEFYEKGKAECHGHGEYWGEDKWTFTYIRYKE